MTVYKKVFTTTVNCTSIQLSEVDALRYELEEIDLEDLWGKYEEELYEEIKFPNEVYSKDIETIIDYGLNRE